MGLEVSCFLCSQMRRKGINRELDWDMQKKKLGGKQKNKKEEGEKKREESVEREGWYRGEQKQRAKRKGPP